jgi:hypothetical protein
VTFRFVPGVRTSERTPRRVGWPAHAGQVQVRLGLGEHHRPAGQAGQPGHDLGHHVVMVRVAAGGQLRPPDRHQPDPPVQRPRADLRPVQVPPDPRQGPAGPAGPAARRSARSAAARPGPGLTAALPAWN